MKTTGMKLKLAALAGMTALTTLADREVVDSSPYATGGDVIYKLTDEQGAVDYIHVFTNIEAAAEFRNSTGNSRLIRYLAVGGGGAGGTARHNGGSSYRTFVGCGGGGGGGVAESLAVIPADGVWSVQVGAGGISASKYTNEESPYMVVGGASSISNANAEIVLAPAGGMGIFYSSGQAQDGAAGGGAGGRVTQNTCVTGGDGTFASHTLQAAFGMYKGGNCAAFYTNETATADGGFIKMLVGGGGGAGGEGETPPTNKGRPGEACSSGAGGDGIACDITGETRYYGAGGGGGGIYRASTICYIPGNFISGGAGGSDGIGGAGSTPYFDADGETVKFANPQPGLDGTGSGGGGGMGKDDAVNALKRGAKGGDGIVVIRYHAEGSGWLSETPMVRSLGAAGNVKFYVAGTTVTDAEGHVWLKPNEPALLKAVDEGGSTVCGCWRDDSTGEIFYGEEVCITPTAYTTYTACFGKPWTYDDAAKTLSNGDWTFIASNTTSGISVYCPVVSSASVGILNFTTPITDVSGNAYSLYCFGQKWAADVFSSTKGKPCRPNVTSLFLPQGLAYIGRASFQYCYNLSDSVCLPEGVLLYQATFYGCSNLTAIVFKGGANGRQRFSSNTHFKYCTRLTGDIVLPDSVTSLPEGIFYDTAITSITLPESCVTLNAAALYSCDNLTNVVLSPQHDDHRIGLLQLRQKAHDCDSVLA